MLDNSETDVLRDRRVVAQLHVKLVQTTSNLLEETQVALRQLFCPAEPPRALSRG